MKVDEQKVKKILREELGYSEIGADMTLLAISRADETIHHTLQQWIEDRTEIEMEHEGITIKDIRRIKGCDYLNAVLWMGVLMEDSKLVELFHKAPKSRIHRHCGGIRRK